MSVHLEVQVWRGSIAESRHRLQAAVRDAAGRAVWSTERPETVTTLRSAAKPFQLTPLVERGHADRFGFGTEDLALMAASHTGSERHLEGVRRILARIGRTEADLACGADAPIDRDTLLALRRARREPEAIHNNCSGKHAGMLAMCVAEGWPIAGYEMPDHPLQRLLHRTVAEICALPVDQVATAIDGCSVSVFAMPLAAMARGYAKLASASGGGDGREAALARIRDAMRAHPWAVGGGERFSSALMEAAPHLVAKGGAEGLECIGWPERGLGFAIKCEDGATRAVAPATVLVLEQLGALDGAARRRLAAWAEPVTRNAAGREVGALRATASAGAMAGG
jgi:L-asparaginase II